MFYYKVLAIEKSHKTYQSVVAVILDRLEAEGGDMGQRFHLLLRHIVVGDRHHLGSIHGSFFLPVVTNDCYPCTEITLIN